MRKCEKAGMKVIERTIVENFHSGADLGPVKRNLFIIEVLLLLMLATEATFVEQGN